MKIKKPNPKSQSEFIDGLLQAANLLIKNLNNIPAKVGTPKGSTELIQRLTMKSKTYK